MNFEAIASVACAVLVWGLADQAGAAPARQWMTVDLVSGVVSYHDYDFTTATNVFNTEEYKSTKMAFRRIPAGFYYYVQNGAYTAQMEKPYYIGMFEVSMAQYELMKDSGYQFSDDAALRAQGRLNRKLVRGTSDSTSAFGQGIDLSSPLGLLNARVQAAMATNLVFDLPTEAMWEVAARAVASGDATRQNCKWYFGSDESLLSAHAFVAGTSAPDDYGNTSGMRVPGCKLPNEWGLYDIYGNAREVCLDGLSGAVDKVIPYGFGEWTQVPLAQGVGQRGRGAAYDDDASQANSVYCRYYDYDWYNQSGVRLALICTDEGSDAVCVPKSVTGGSDLYVPYAWFAGYPSFVAKFGDDYPAAAMMSTGKTAADGSPAYVWQDFVNGCDPTNPEDVFRATIEFRDGEPCVGWTPNLNSNGINRIYRILGKPELSDESGDWRRFRPGDKFFKVWVAMPDGVSSSDEPGQVARERNLLCHLSFDDYGNGGLNVLKVEGGDDAVVRTTKESPVEGLGVVETVTDSSVLAGLEPGDGAVFIPKGTHLALPIPSALLDRDGHPYTIKMKVKFPSFGKYYSLLNMPASNDSDAMVYLTSATDPAITMKITNKGAGGGIEGGRGFTANQWEEVTLQFGELSTKVFLNGKEIFSWGVALSTTYANCLGLGEGGYFVISGDNDSDDNAMYWADVKVYDGIVDP